MKMNQSSIFEMGTVDFAHFSSPSPFKWFENWKICLICRKKDCLKVLKLSALNIFKTALTKTVSHKLIEAKLTAISKKYQLKTVLTFKNGLESLICPYFGDYGYKNQKLLRIKILCTKVILLSVFHCNTQLCYCPLCQILFNLLHY